MSGRPSPETIQLAYNAIFASGLPLSKLKDASIDGHLREILVNKPRATPKTADTVVIPGRSIAWKLFLLPQPPLTSDIAGSPSPPLFSLRETRQNYVRLLKERMRAPDGSYEAGFTLPGETEPLPTVKQQKGDWERNNPLSLDDQNPWQIYFQSVELRRTIAQDVERTFPDIAYFRQPYVQSLLTIILFLHCAEDPEIGYRQGMHELLAPILYAVDQDSLKPGTVRKDTSSSQDLRELCDDTWIAADAWALFGLLMKSARDWYEWQEPPRQQVTLNGPVQSQTYTPPIIRICNTIQNECLKPVDPLLWSRMQEVGIEPQLYGIRWLRLLFSREFGLSDLLNLWDGIFAVDPSLGIAKWVTVAMLVRIRNDIIPFDYSGQLTALLRYPAAPPNPQIAMAHTSLLLRQALSLRASPTPTGGVTLMMENRDFLGIPAEVPEAPVTRRFEGGRLARGGHRPNAQSFDHRRDLTGIQDLITSRLSDVNSAVASTVSELRRNLPELNLNDISSAIMGPTDAASDFATARYQAMSRQGAKSPRQPYRTDEAGDPHLRDTKLSRAMAWALQTLREPAAASEEESKYRKAAAMETLSYVQQALSDSGSLPLDESRLRCPWDGTRDRAASPDQVPAVTSRQAGSSGPVARDGPKLSGKPNPFSRHDSPASTFSQHRSAQRAGQSNSLFSPGSPTNSRHDSAMSLHVKTSSQPTKPPIDDPLGAFN